MQHLIILVPPLADGQDQGSIVGSRYGATIDRFGLEGELLTATSRLENTMELIGVSESGDDQHSLSIGIPSPKCGVTNRLVLSETFREIGGNGWHAPGFNGGGPKSVWVERLGQNPARRVELKPHADRKEQRD